MKAKTAFLALALVTLFVGPAFADTMVLSFTNIWIDHNDKLIIDGSSNTVQWYYFGNYSAIGLWPSNQLANQIPTRVIVTNNGSQLLDTNWYQWTTVPSGPSYSSTLAIPALPAIADSVTIIPAGRGSSTWGNSYPVITVEYLDYQLYADWYSATVTIEYTRSAVPLPGALMLFAPGLAGLAFVRRLLRGSHLYP